MNVTVFSTRCPQCSFLETRLRQANIKYNIVYGSEEIIRRGYRSAPILEVEGVGSMTYADALKWIKSQEEGESDAR